ncbi:ATP-binding protein [Paenibacillus shunpengii]|uniref:histidine kinase n=1 Tax=Paenibacillus shunpengii TaxID=2054424 RepID=A0ABW5SIT6_9BACL
MKIGPRVSAAIILCLLGVLFILPQAVLHAQDKDIQKLSRDMLWFNDSVNVSYEELMEGNYKWTAIDDSYSAEDMDPSIARAAWTRIKLPADLDERSGLLFEYIYGQQIDIYIDGERILGEFNNYPFDRNHILLSLDQEDSGKTVYIWTHSSDRTVGLSQNAWTGSYKDLSGMYLRDGLSSVLMGGILLLLAVLIAVTCLFMTRVNTRQWSSMMGVIICFGLAILLYSPTLYTLYPDYSWILVTGFETALILLLPLLAYCFEQMIGPGPGGLINKLWKSMLVYIALCMLVRVVNALTGDFIYPFYEFLTRPVFGVVFIVELILLTYFAILEARKGNRKAYLLSFGSGIFTVAAVVEWILYYTLNWYDFWMMKWGMAAFTVSLVIIKTNPLWGKHEQVELYTKELEVFNNELQRSEKIKIISELAASVAHEVRNPLQVTRGFLQLMSKQENLRNRRYVSIAIEELDRASEIINDFLTFAKPEFDQIRLINLAEEFNHIEGVLIPMANLEGCVITMDVPENLWVRGNTSKFKQAFINILKNSIEAIQGSGEVRVKAYSRGKEIFIHVQDTGIGMDEQELMRLGEPYFSNKTKGTGLGMMVTFRIIEAMDGSIEYSSEKGIGTEAVIRFPSGT